MPKNEKKAKAESSVKVAERSTTKKGELSLVEKLAKDNGIPNWELAGLMRFAGWAEGKSVTEKELKAALKRFRKRRMGNQ
jgi:hypothetical protein